MKETLRFIKESYHVLVFPVGVTVCMAIAIIWVSVKPYNACGHPESECKKEKVVKKKPRNHFLSKSVSEIPESRDGIKEFQRANGLMVDGIVGIRTQDACFKQCFGAVK